MPPTLTANAAARACGLTGSDRIAEQQAHLTAPDIKIDGHRRPERRLEETA